MDILMILFILSLFGVIFYLYKNLTDLKLSCIRISNENNYLKTRIEDLKTYKNDVSQTFEILNNDLKVINEELKRHEQNTTLENLEENQTNQENSNLESIPQNENPQNENLQNENLQNFITPMEIFSQYFFRSDNLNENGRNTRGNFGIINRNFNRENFQNPVVGDYADQFLNTISRHLENLS